MVISPPERITRATCKEVARAPTASVGPFTVMRYIISTGSDVSLSTTVGTRICGATTHEIRSAWASVPEDSEYRSLYVLKMDSDILQMYRGTFPYHLPPRGQWKSKKDELDMTVAISELATNSWKPNL